jgi:hypothetical protein
MLRLFIATISVIIAVHVILSSSEARADCGYGGQRYSAGAQICPSGNDNSLECQTGGFWTSSSNSCSYHSEYYTQRIYR